MDKAITLISVGSTIQLAAKTLTDQINELLESGTGPYRLVSTAYMPGMADNQARILPGMQQPNIIIIGVATLQRQMSLTEDPDVAELFNLAKQAIEQNL